MSKFFQNSTVVLAGLATSILTAIVVTIFDRLTGLNVFTFSLWVVIPAGAGLCGFAAASGYYFAAKHWHQQPSGLLLVQMLIIAAFTQMLIYWLEYQTLTVEGEHVADFVAFSKYLDVTLTSAHMRMGRAAQVDTGEVGSFGYWLAVFQFIGFIIGGGVVYLQLTDQHSCDECRKYLRKVITKADSFVDYGSFAEYFDGVYAHPVDSPEFASHVGRDPSAGKAGKGSINLTTLIYECPKCYKQYVKETTQVYNGSSWKDVTELNRFIVMPNGVDVRPAFNGYRAR